MWVCVFVCLCAHPSVQAVTSESLYIEASFLVCKYIFTICRWSLSNKVIRSRSISYEKNDNFTYLNMLIICMWLQVIYKVKFIHQGEGHIKVKVKISTSLLILCHLFCPYIYLKGEPVCYAQMILTLFPIRRALAICILWVIWSV